MDRAYCTPEDVQSLIGSSLSGRDLGKLIAAATVRFENETGRVFVASDSEARMFLVAREQPGFCPIDDLLSLTSITWEGVALSAAQYRLMPGGSLTPKTSVVDLVDAWSESDEIAITGVWGYCQTPPADVREAVSTWVIRVVKSADAGFEDATAVPEMGQLVYKSAIPKEVWRVIDRYQRKTPKR